MLWIGDSVGGTTQLRNEFVLPVHAALAHATLFVAAAGYGWVSGYTRVTARERNWVLDDCESRYYRAESPRRPSEALQRLHGQIALGAKTPSIKRSRFRNTIFQILALDPSVLSEGVKMTP